MTLCSLVDSTKFFDSCCLYIDKTTQAQVAEKQSSEDRGWGQEEDNWGQKFLQNGGTHIISLKTIIWEVTY